MKIFLSFIGNNDCFPGEKPGAILSALEQKKFDRAYLLYNHDRYLKPATLIQQYCRTHFPETEIVLQAAEAHDPIDYNLVYPAMYQAVRKIVKENSGAEFTVSLTSGTPTMPACRIFLVQGGVIDATLIQVSGEAGISEVSFEPDDFPKIRRVKKIRAEMTRLARENRQLKSRLGLAYDPIVGQSPGILKVKEQVKIFTEADFPVFFIRGWGR